MSHAHWQSDVFPALINSHCFVPDRCFGVFESPERTDQSEAETSSTFSPVIVESREQHRQSSSGEVRPAPEQGQSLVKINLPAQGVDQSLDEIIKNFIANSKDS